MKETKKLRNEIEDINKKNCSIMIEVNKIKSLYKDNLKQIKQHDCKLEEKEDINKKLKE